MAMAASLGLRVIFKATFEINLPECGFHQKDFQPDFYLVLCTLSSSSCRTLKNYLQVSHPVSYGHFQASNLPIFILDFRHLPLLQPRFNLFGKTCALMEM